MNFIKILGTALALSICSHSYSQLRIVCIGNSITQGKNELKADKTYEYGYRPWLWEKLTLQGFNVDMVGYNPFFFLETPGKQTLIFPNQTGKTFDRDCEAYYGITSDVFLNGSASYGWTGSPLPPYRERINDPIKGYAADIALIHIGTNDPDSTKALVAKTRQNIISIVGILREKNPKITILLAKLITGWKKINPEIEGICNEISTKKSPVIAVDLSTGFVNKVGLKETMTYDHVHPNTAGQLFMMDRWHKAIIANLRDSEKPTLAGRITVSETTPNFLTVSWPAAEDNYGIAAYEIKMGRRLLATVPFPTTSFNISNLKSGVKHKIQVIAKDFGNNSSTPLTVKVKTNRSL